MDEFATVDSSLVRNDSAEPVRAEDGLEHPREVRTAAQHLATVDIDHLTGYVAGCVAEQDTAAFAMSSTSPGRGSGVQAA